jgi:2'-5' RNA ligase
MNDKYLYLAAQFDNETQGILSGYYDILRQNGFEGNQTKNIPYHFTLGKRELDYEKHLKDDLELICASTTRIDIHLSHIGLFSKKVLFIAPDMNTELLTLQQKFFPQIGHGAYDWTAHATMLLDDQDKVLNALPIMTEIFRPFIAHIDSIGLYEFFPMRFIKEYSLINAQHK